MVGLISVVNKFIHTVSDNDILIHRGTALGNPFRINDQNCITGHGIFDREGVIQAYKDWMAYQLTGFQNPVVVAALDEIAFRILDGRDVNLVCFCKPKACHGDYIKELIEDKLNG